MSAHPALALTPTPPETGSSGQFNPETRHQRNGARRDPLRFFDRIGGRLSRAGEVACGSFTTQAVNVARPHASALPRKRKQNQSIGICRERFFNKIAAKRQLRCPSLRGEAAVTPPL
jgi:hypothetical protein